VLQHVLSALPETILMYLAPQAALPALLEQSHLQEVQAVLHALLVPSNKAINAYRAL
jgi:hypothetical protein